MTEASTLTNIFLRIFLLYPSPSKGGGGVINLSGGDYLVSSPKGCCSGISPGDGPPPFVERLVHRRPTTLMICHSRLHSENAMILNVLNIV